MIHLRFKQWDLYNKRSKEYKHPVWFSFHNDFATNKNFYRFSNEERLVFVYLLCFASQENDGGAFLLDEDHFCDQCKVKIKDLKSCIQKLIEKHILDLSGSCGDRDGIVSRQITAVTDRTDITEQDKTKQTEHTFAQSDSDESSIAVVLPEFTSISDVLETRKVDLKSQRAILEAFPEPEWVISEIRKMIAWESVNKSRVKKNFGRFATNWLTKGWDSRRISIKYGSNSNNDDFVKRMKEKLK